MRYGTGYEITLSLRAQKWSYSGFGYDIFCLSLKGRGRAEKGGGAPDAVEQKWKTAEGRKDPTDMTDLLPGPAQPVCHAMWLARRAGRSGLSQRKKEKKNRLGRENKLMYMYGRNCTSPLSDIRIRKVTKSHHGPFVGGMFQSEK